MGENSRKILHVINVLCLALILGHYLRMLNTHKNIYMYVCIHMYCDDRRRQRRNMYIILAHTRSNIQYQQTHITHIYHYICIYI